MKASLLKKLLEYEGISCEDLDTRGFLIQTDALIPIVEYMIKSPALGCDYLALMTASDHPKDEEIHLTYIIESLEGTAKTWLRIHVPRSGASVPSLTPYFEAANWLEREVFDLYGVHFENHPDLRRILTPDDFVGHGMLKDYKREGFFVAKPTKISGVKV